jgi:hypothetical protein
MSSCTEIKLRSGVAALIDVEDDNLVSDYVWWSQGGYIHGYLAPNWNGPRMLLHRLVMNAPAGVGVDHINGNPLDNRKCNLRLANQQQNMRNAKKFTRKCSSRYKGVCFKQGKYWQAYIGVDRKQIHIGYFGAEEEAAKAYDRRALELFGEFARLNFHVQLYR